VIVVEGGRGRWSHRLPADDRKVGRALGMVTTAETANGQHCDTEVCIAPQKKMTVYRFFVPDAGLNAGGWRSCMRLNGSGSTLSDHFTAHGVCRAGGLGP